jgi:hypothetical protein
VSADERYLTYADNVYFLGPRIDGIGEIGPYIFGVNSEFDIEGLKNVPGYFIIDTTTDNKYLGMNRKQFNEKIIEIGIEEIEMVGPGKLFVEKLREYSCI